MLSGYEALLIELWEDDLYSCPNLDIVAYKAVKNALIIRVVPKMPFQASAFIKGIYTRRISRIDFVAPEMLHCSRTSEYAALLAFMAPRSS